MLLLLARLLCRAVVLTVAVVALAAIILKRRQVDDYRRIENMDFVKYPYDSLTAWQHFRHHLEKVLVRESPVGLGILRNFPPELDELLDQIFE